MPNYVLVKDCVVENIFVCDTDENAKSLYAGETIVNVEGVAVGIGWDYGEGVFTNPYAPQSPTPAELYEEELSVINAEYETDKQQLANEFLNASLFFGSNEATKKDLIYKKLMVRNQKYTADLNALDEKYGG